MKELNSLGTYAEKKLLALINRLSAVMRTKTLDLQAIDAALLRLEGWSRDEDYLVRSFQFQNFAAAFGFMTQVALISENLGHHPIWTQDGAVVEVKLTTHSADGITHLDCTLAGKMNVVAHNMGLQPETTA